MASNAQQQQRHGWRYRANVGARVLAGTAGAYVIAALFAAALARTLPGSRLDAVLIATLLAYVIGPAVTIWAFLARGPWRVWGGVLGCAVALAAVYWLAGPRA